VLVNTDNYGPLRSLALGLVMDFAGRMFGAHAIRGMAADLSGNGLVLVGPKGTNKTELFFGLLKDARFRIQTNDVIFVRPGAGSAPTDSVERKFYIPTNTVESFDRLAPLFDRSKCENVVARKEDCRDEGCLRGDDCRLDRGSAYCYKASPEGHALLDPGWIGGRAAVSKRTNLRWIFILRNDPTSPAVIKLEKTEALRILEAGERAPFFNPHLLVTTPERIELEKAFFKRLLDVAACYLFNSGVAGADKIKEIVEK
jgi:hypothetical protein